MLCHLIQKLLGLTGLLVLLISLLGASQSYYITTTGDDNNSGLSEAEAWQTFSHAVEVVQPGDTVYIKAGLYTDNPMYLYKTSGTRLHPIRFIGYLHVPGDLDLPNEVYNPHKPATVSLPDAASFPTIDGEFQNNSYSGIEIHQLNYIELSNLHVTGYQSNITLYQAHFNQLDNLIVSKARDTLVYNGFGLRLTLSNYNTLNHIYAVSNQGENISLVSSHYNMLENCQSHGGLPGDDAGLDDGTDYYIVITKSHSNTIRNCLAQRHSGIQHGGHGIGIKSKGVDSYDNIIMNSVIRGTSKGFYVNHQQSYNNLFINDTVYGDPTIANLITRGFIARDGAHDNLFKGCRGDKLDFGINLYDSPEDGGFGQEENNNMFAYCTFTETLQSVILFEHSANNNLFESLQADGAPRLVTINKSVQGRWENNLLRNSQLNNVDNIGDLWFNVSSPSP